MTHDELVEAVSAAIITEQDDYGDAPAEDMARAAIAIVVEQCAKVADTEEVPDGSNPPATFAFASPVEAAIGGVIATKEAIAKRIRALAGPRPESETKKAPPAGAGAP